MGCHEQSNSSSCLIAAFGQDWVACDRFCQLSLVWSASFATQESDLPCQNVRHRSVCHSRVSSAGCQDFNFHRDSCVRHCHDDQLVPLAIWLSLETRFRGLNAQDQMLGCSRCQSNPRPTFPSQEDWLDQRRNRGIHWATSRLSFLSRAQLNLHFRFQFMIP